MSKLLNTHADGLSTTDLIERIRSARSPEEPAEAVPTSEDEAEQEAETAELEEVSEELDEQESEAESEEFDDDTLYLIGDTEISLKQIKELKQSELRQSDYTRKTQELSNQRKALEAERAELNKLKERYNTEISGLQSLLDSGDSNIDMDELRDTDPSEYLRIKEQQEKRRKAVKERTKLQNEERATKRRESARKLIESKPEWAGENGQALQKKESEQALQYAESIGFSDDDISGIDDHRIYLMMIDAAKYRQGETSKSAAKKKIAKAPVATPAKRSAKKPSTTMEEAKQRLRKTGSKKDAISAIKQYLGG